MEMELKTQQLEARIASLENLTTVLIATWAIEMNDPDGESDYICLAAAKLAQSRLRMSQVGPEKQVARSALRYGAMALERLREYLVSRQGL